jgi:hypothetical protein
MTDKVFLCFTFFHMKESKVRVSLVRFLSRDKK